MSKTPLVSILIINWNGKKHLKQCLKSLEKVTYRNYEIVVADQASTDGSFEFVKKYYPKVNLVRFKKNYGFATANNKAIKHTKGDLVLLLNNDTIVEPGFLSILVKEIQNKNTGIVQPKICFADKKRIQSAGSFLTYTGFLYHQGFKASIKEKQFDAEEKVFSANGACMLVKKSLVKRLGLFDARYFAYFEETDFCWRSWLYGYDTVYAPKAVIYHKGGQTSQFLASDFVQYHSFKNRICSLLKNLSVRKLFVILPLHLALTEAAAIAFLFYGKLQHFTSINKAILWNLFNLPETLRKRHFVQNKIRKISDKALFDIIVKKVGPSHFLSLFTHSANAKTD